MRAHPAGSGWGCGLGLARRERREGGRYRVNSEAEPIRLDDGAGQDVKETGVKASSRLSILSDWAQEDIGGQGWRRDSRSSA